MAEVVGVAASIATLIEVAGKTGRTISRIRRLQASPPRYVLAAQDEVERFTAALDLIQDILSNGSTAPSDKAKAELAKLHDQAIVALDEFDGYLREKVICDQPSGNSALKLRRRAWLKEVFGEAQSEFLDFQQRLMSIKQNLQLVLQALHFQTPSKASLHLQRVSVVQAGVTTTVDAGDRDLTAAYLEKVVVSSSTTLTNSGCAGDSATIASSIAQRDDYIVFDMQRAPQGCRKHCPCQCHIAFRGSTPRWLQGLMGTVFLNLSGVPLINRRTCNVKSCGGKGSATGRARLQYVMPTWALPYAIETTASWRTLNGLGGTWSLKIPRFMNAAHLYNQFFWLMQHGTVREIQELMAKSGMRAFDVFDGSPNINSTLFPLAVNNLRPDVCQMLIENGTDVSHRDACGVSVAGFFWLIQHAGHEFDDLREHPVLAEIYETLELIPGHDLVINNASEQLARHLVSFPAAITLRDDTGFTLLHWAAACGMVDALDVLIMAGADVNAVCKRGRTPLMWACCLQECHALSESLIRGGADVNLTDISGDNALICLLLSSPVNAATVALLLDAGTNINHAGTDGATALLRAALTNCDGIRESCLLLLERGASLTEYDDHLWKPVTYAVFYNNHDVLDLFIEHGAPLNLIREADGATIITIAASRADIRTMKRLRDARIEGLPLDEGTLQNYWDLFSERDEYFAGFKVPLEDETRAFQELLDSIVPLDPSLKLPTPEPLRLIPGAFPSDEPREKVCVDLRTEKSSSKGESDGTNAPSIESMA